MELCCALLSVRDLLLSVLHCSEISRNWLGRYVNCSTEWIPISYLSLSALIWSSCKPKRRRCRAHSNFNNFFFSHPQSRLDFSHEAKRARAHQMKKSFIFSTRAALFSALLTSNLLAGFRANRDLAGNCVQMTNQLTVRVRPTHKKNWSKQKWSRKKKDRVRASNRFSFVMLSISSLVRLIFFLWIPHKTWPLSTPVLLRGVCIYVLVIFHFNYEVSSLTVRFCYNYHPSIVGMGLRRLLWGGRRASKPEKTKKKNGKRCRKVLRLIFSSVSQALFMFHFSKTFFFLLRTYIYLFQLFYYAGSPPTVHFAEEIKNHRPESEFVIGNLFWCFNQLRWRLCGNFTLILCETERKLNDLNCARLIKSRSDAFLRCSMGSWFFPIYIIHMFRGFDWSREL